jgi:prevent-host-death family protein
MVMSQPASTIGASAFKARCLVLLDRVAKTGESLVITKRGKAVARLVPVQPAGPVSLRGSVTVRGDIVASILDQWETDR